MAPGLARGVLSGFKIREWQESVPAIDVGLAFQIDHTGLTKRLMLSRIMRMRMRTVF